MADNLLRAHQLKFYDTMFFEKKEGTWQTRCGICKESIFGIPSLILRHIQENHPPYYALLILSGL